MATEPTMATAANSTTASSPLIVPYIAQDDAIRAHDALRLGRA